jgi:hypothetical protein
MAYIEGNSLYIRGASDTKGLLSVDIHECLFKYNYGINVAFGSAVSIHGEQEVKEKDTVGFFKKNTGKTTLEKVQAQRNKHLVE